MARRVPRGPGSKVAGPEYDPHVSVPPRSLPHPGRGRAWDRRTRQAWQALVGEPWTADWSASDVALATRWCHLQQAFWEAFDRGDSPSALKSLNAELRAMEASLFASPASRQANRVQPKKTGVRSLPTSGVPLSDLGLA